MHGIQTKGKAKEENKGLVKKEETKMIKTEKAIYTHLYFPIFLFRMIDWLYQSMARHHLKVYCKDPLLDCLENQYFSVDDCEFFETRPSSSTPS